VGRSRRSLTRDYAQASERLRTYLDEAEAVIVAAVDGD